MPSRQDQLHSHQFAVRRVVSALVARESDPASVPLRRTGGAVLAGVLLAALSIGAVAVYGLLSPGGSGRWKNTNAVIMEKETGALYVYRAGRLHPVPNFASARLILRTGTAKTVAVSRRSMRSVPRGTPIGLAGAPASLPDRLLRTPWMVCSRSSSSTMLVGAPVAGPPLGDRGLLVGVPGGDRYLVWKYRRYRVRPDALAALAWSQRAVLPVAPALVTALPAGPDLAVPAVPGRGGGRVYAVERAGGGDDLLVAVPGGLASVTRLQADLLLATGPDAGPVRLSRAQFNATAGGSPVPALDPAATSGEGALPPSAPALVSSDGAVCAGEGRVVPDAALPDLATAVEVTRPAGAGVLVDRVLVAPGAGALVEAVASQTGPGTLCLVTDLGIRYALPGAEVAAMLGYGDQRPVRLPVEVVSLLPAGVALDPAAIS